VVRWFVEAKRIEGDRHFLDCPYCRCHAEKVYWWQRYEAAQREDGAQILRDVVDAIDALEALPDDNNRIVRFIVKKLSERRGVLSEMADAFVRAANFTSFPEWYKANPNPE
jgi:hypothetical protein